MSQIEEGPVAHPSDQIISAGLPAGGRGEKEDEASFDCWAITPGCRGCMRTQSR